MPYVYAALAWLLPENASLAAFALLGLVAALGSVGAIVYFARSTMNGVLLGVGLLLTQTNLKFALNGWDHLYQGAAFVAALALAWSRPSRGRLVAIGALLAAGSVIRPDGALIAIAILVTVFTLVPERRRVWLACVAPYVLLVAGVVVVNLAQFGTLTPTTTRLKFGAAPQLQYVIDYFVANSLGSYTAATFMLLLLIFIVIFARVLPMRRVLPVVVASFVTAAVATLNSDVFPGGRMYWVPALVVAMVVALEAPPIVQVGAASIQDLRGAREDRSVPARTKVLIASVATALGLAVVATAVVGLQYAVVARDEVVDNATSKQYILAQWVNQHLDPTDGAVGVFFGGVSFDLPRYEIAGLLGKGDEIIAALPARKKGLPGHNKWSIDTTLDKWQPQVILPTTVIECRAPRAGGKP